jgi:DNA polymerase-3 subunit gamma/tau
LGRIAKEENVSISDAGLICVARAGEGSLRDAQSIFDQVLSYSGNDVKDSDIEELLGLNDMRFVFDLSTAILDRNPGACLNIIDEAYYSGVDIKQFYQMLLDHFMKLFTLKVSDSDSVLEDSPDHEVAEFKKQNEKVSRETLRRLLDTLAGEENSIRRGLGPRINLEYVVVKMACLEPLIPIDEFVLRMERLEKDLRSEGPMVRQVVETEDIVYEGFDNGVEQEAEEVEEKAEHGDLWERFKGFVKKKSYPLWSKVEHGEFLGYGDGCFKIGFPEGSVILEYITEEPQIGNLIQVSKDFFNDDVKVKIEPLSCEKIVRNSAGNARNELLNHPLALKVIEVFEDAEIHSTNVNGKR